MPVAVYFPIAQEIAFNCRSIGQDYIHLGCHARGRLKTRMHILHFLFPLFILVLLRVVGGSTFSFPYFSFCCLCLCFGLIQGEEHEILSF